MAVALWLAATSSALKAILHPLDNWIEALALDFRVGDGKHVHYASTARENCFFVIDLITAMATHHKPRLAVWLIGYVFVAFRVG